ncbi:MAG: MBOAT family O-acyltransferase, partial [Acidimicrobiales bacterium]
VSSAIVTPVFTSPSQHSAPEAIFAAWGYAVQIYCDFSGYTDIAIGLALLLGIRFPQNFDAPYTARNLQDFWRRWHMTLSRWLRDYLYIPLGGSAGSQAQTVRNIMITMVLGGLWHGAAWTFVAWGTLQGLGQSFGHLRRTSRVRRGLPAVADGPVRVWVQRFLTFQFVCLGWVFFNASGMSQAFALLGRVLKGWGQPSPLVTPLLVVTVLGIIAAQFVPTLSVGRLQAVFSRQRAAVQVGLLGFALLGITTFGPVGVAPFIYYRF